MKFHKGIKVATHLYGTEIWEIYKKDISYTKCRGDFLNICMGIYEN